MNRILALLLLTFTLPTWAAEPASPYAGEQARDIKALSPSEVDDYLNGRGMGFAKAAELNSYPGPRHVLDLAVQLHLNDEQTARTQALFSAMQARASALGSQLVEKEKTLDTLFASQQIDDAQLKALLQDIGALQAELRFVHLSTHLEQTALLTPHQVQTYNQLRGYGGGAAQHQHQHRH